MEEQTEKILNAEKQVADYQIEFKHVRDSYLTLIN